MRVRTRRPKRVSEFYLSQAIPKLALYKEESTYRCFYHLDRLKIISVLVNFRSVVSSVNRGEIQFS